MPELANQSTVGIILISIKGAYRSYRLLDVIKSSGLPFLELDASTPESMFHLLEQSRSGQLIRIGRLLTKKEMATYESHFRAQTSDFAKRHDWIVILEDDAIINEASVKLLNALALIKSNRPTFINLYPNRGKLFSADRFALFDSNSFVKVDYLYPGAVAYAINNAAMSRINEVRNNRVITPTDFPPFFNTFEKFIYLSTEVISHSDVVESLVYNSDGIPKNRKSLVYLGLFSLMSYLLFRKENSSFSNFLDLEVRQRIIRKLL